MADAILDGRIELAGALAERWDRKTPGRIRTPCRRAARAGCVRASVLRRSAARDRRQCAPAPACNGSGRRVARLQRLRARRAAWRCSPPNRRARRRSAPKRGRARRRAHRRRFRNHRPAPAVRSRARRGALSAMRSRRTSRRFPRRRRCRAPIARSSSMPVSASTSRISASLPRLPLARTTRLKSTIRRPAPRAAARKARRRLSRRARAAHRALRDGTRGLPPCPAAR